MYTYKLIALFAAILAVGVSAAPEGGVIARDTPVSFPPDLAIRDVPNLVAQSSVIMPRSPNKHRHRGRNHRGAPSQWRPRRPGRGQRGRRPDGLGDGPMGPMQGVQGGQGGRGQGGRGRGRGRGRGDQVDQGPGGRGQYSPPGAPPPPPPPVAPPLPGAPPPQSPPVTTDAGVTDGAPPVTAETEVTDGTPPAY